MSSAFIAAFRGNGSAYRVATCRWRGFTLVELMVTIAIAAILTMIAVPSFQRLILSNRLTTSANALVDAVNAARLEAIKLNATTQFCGSSTTNTGDTLGAACTQSGAVYALPQSATTAGQVRAPPPGVTPPVQSGTINAIRFSGQGFGYAPAAGPNNLYSGNIAVVCTSQLASGNQRIVSMTAGSILAVASSTGTCP